MVSGFQVAERPKIMIVTDLEGVGGVNNADEQLLPGQRRFEESCRLLAGEVNAAVEGAFKGGAREVALSIDEIDRRAQLIQGGRGPRTTTWRTGCTTGSCSWGSMPWRALRWVCSLIPRAS